MNALGRHLLVELYGCPPAGLNDLEHVRASMVAAAQAANATVVDASFHSFAPQGISGAVLLAESHISIHTWPEYQYAAVDCFTCGAHCDPHAGVRELAARLGSQRLSIHEVERGCEVLGGPPAAPAPALSPVVPLAAV